MSLPATLLTVLLETCLVAKERPRDAQPNASQQIANKLDLLPIDTHFLQLGHSSLDASLSLQPMHLDIVNLPSFKKQFIVFKMVKRRQTWRPGT